MKKGKSLIFNRRFSAPLDDNDGEIQRRTPDPKAAASETTREDIFQIITTF